MAKILRLTTQKKTAKRSALIPLQRRKAKRLEEPDFNYTTTPEPGVEVMIDGHPHGFLTLKAFRQMILVIREEIELSDNPELLDILDE